MLFPHSHGVGTARAVRKKVLPEQAGGGFGVSFEFDDGWLAARFHLTKAEAERQAARIGESELVPHQNARSGLLVRPLKQSRSGDQRDACGGERLI